MDSPATTNSPAATNPPASQAHTQGEQRRRRRRRRRLAERLWPVNWKKIGAYVIAYSLAVLICWQI